MQFGDAAVETQRVVVRHKKGRFRLEVQYIWPHRCFLPLTDIRRIAHNEVKMSDGIDVLCEYIGLSEIDFHAVTLRILFRYYDSVGGDVNARYVPFRMCFC